MNVTAAPDGLLRWVETESPTRHREGVNAMLDLVEQAVSGLPVAIERRPGRDGLGDIVVLRSAPDRHERGILMLSHVDTVHPLGASAFDLPVRVEGNRLYGPGIYDMKGGAWLGLHAFRQAVTSGTAKAPLTYIFTPDEEIGSPTSRETIEAAALRAAFVLVTEPARQGGRIVTSRKGVGRFEFDIEGRPSHAGSRHEDGRSAIREAARQILAVEGLTDYARGITTTVGQMSGGTAPNVIPHRAWFCADLRVTTMLDGDTLQRLILGLQPDDPDIRMTIAGGMNRPPYEKTPAVAALFETAQALAADLEDGLAFDLQDVPMAGGGSDGNFTAALGVPTLDGLGIDGDGAHTLQEYGLISSIAPRQALMRRLMETLV